MHAKYVKRPLKRLHVKFTICACTWNEAVTTFLMDFIMRSMQVRNRCSPYALALLERQV